MTSTLTSSTAAQQHLLDRRVVWLGDEVTDESANLVSAQLLHLSLVDPESDVALVINSPGGSVMAGLAVYDTMQLIPNDVATIAVGFAASMGQVLLCAGTPGKRLALPHAQIVMHEGSAGLGGWAADVEIQAANLVTTLDRLRAIIARHCDKPIAEVEQDVGRDRWFDAQQALEYGFIDRIVNSIEDIVPTPLSRQVGLTSTVRTNP